MTFSIAVHSISAEATADPGRILGLMTAFEQTAALRGALGVGLFSAIAAGCDTVEALSERCGASPRGARMLADALVVYGLLTKREGLYGQWRYGLAPDAAAFLDAASPDYIGEAARFLASPEKIALYFDDPAGWVRRGGPADAANTAPDSAVWVDFAQGMTNLMRPIAKSLAQALASRDLAVGRILDIAAGHGYFGIETAKVFPNAELVALDWAAVAAVALANAVKEGVGDRFTSICGSAFETELGEGYDLVLVPNFLHHFDRPTCIAFLSRVAQSLASSPAAGVAIVEYTPEEDRVTPPVAALFALSMLTGTPAGDAYTAQDLGEMCHSAGLSEIEIEPLAGTAQTLILARQPAS